MQKKKQQLKSNTASNSGDPSPENSTQSNRNPEAIQDSSGVKNLTGFDSQQALSDSGALFAVQPQVPPKAPILCIIGLGNPGREYESTRHNIGFFLVEAIAEKLGLRFRKPWFSDYLMAEMSLPEGQSYRKILLVKPLTFMNRSGKIIPHLLRRFGKAIQFLVAVDNMDLPPGQIRLKLRGGTAGHNGLKSMTQYLDKDFWPIYIGVGHPGSRDAVISHVMGVPPEDEQVSFGALASLATDLLLQLPVEDAGKIAGHINALDSTAASAVPTEAI